MKLAIQAALATGLIVVVSSLMILAASSIILRDRLEQDVSTLLTAQVENQVDAIRDRIDGIIDDAGAIANGPLARAFVGGQDPEADRARLLAQMVSTLAAHDSFLQIRLIGTSGRELARVNRRDGKAQIVADTELQDKSGNEYVTQMLRLGRGEVYVSALDLNREFGAIVEPIEPTVRIALPVFDPGGRRRGGIVVNIDVRQLLPARRIGSLRFFVIDEDGEFLQHVDRAKEFGIELQSGITLATELGDGAALPTDWSRGTIVLDHGLATGEPEILAYREMTVETSGAPRIWRVLAVKPLSIAFAPLAGLLSQISLVVIGVALAGCAAGWFAALGVTRQVRRIAGTARELTAGNLSVDIEIKGTGSVADMAGALRTMTLELKRRIADERQARLELKKLNLELARSNQELENFARASAHDLRTPLRAIATLLEWIDEDLEGAEMPSGIPEHLAEMRQQSGRMETLIAGLLEYSRVGRDESRPAPLDVAQSVGKALATLALPEEFRVDVDVGPKVVVAVEAEIELILRNLVQNARQHHDRETGRIAIRVSAARENLVIEVEDDGPGIPPDQHANVLMPLRTLRSRDDGGGSGLGLAMVGRVVERWGGTIEVISHPPRRGTTIRASLPLPPADATEAGEAAAA